MNTGMSTEERIERLERQIARLQDRQAELYRDLARAERDQWQGRIDDLEVQLHLASMEGNDRISLLMEQLRSRWAGVRGQFDDAAETATEVRDALRSGLASAVRDVRKALIESKDRISS